MALTTVGSSAKAMKLRTCGRCNTEQPLSEFQKKKKRNAPESQCKTCKAAYMKAYHLANKENQNARSNAWYQSNKVRHRESHDAWKLANPEKTAAIGRSTHLRLTFGLTVEQYKDRLDAQGGVCAICRSECKTGRRLSVDHDRSCCPTHKSCGTCIRGLLCASCNQSIGKMGDSPQRLRVAADYLEAHTNTILNRRNVI